MTLSEAHMVAKIERLEVELTAERIRLQELASAAAEVHRVVPGPLPGHVAISMARLGRALKELSPDRRLPHLGACPSCGPESAGVGPCAKHGGT